VPLTLHPPIELVQYVARHRRAPAYMQGEAVCEDPWVLDCASALGLSLNAQLNSGLS